MFRKLLLFVTVASLSARPAHAQLVVLDPGNLVQTTLIAYRMQQHYAELRAQYLTILRMGQGLGNLDRYRISTIPITAHDPSRWDFGRAWIQGLNTGETRHQVVECQGCNSARFRLTAVDDLDTDPETGEPVETSRTYPETNPKARPATKELTGLPDSVSSMYREALNAFNAGHMS